MGLNIEYVNGQTPLDEDEKEGLLIRSITTRQELDEFEQQNIENAIEWTLGRKFKKEYVFSEVFIKELHSKMFGNIWKWAGQFRRTNKNLGVDKNEIAISLRYLLDDCLFWIKNQTYSEEEIAIRFKHRIVSIHCFPNGNGRHSRLLADITANHIFNKPVFTWGRTLLSNVSSIRSDYIQALKKADQGDIQPLIKFSRS